MKVVVRAEVRPTEDKEKVVKALLNLFDLQLKEEASGHVKLIVGEGGEEVLMKFRRLLMEQRILDAARQYLLRGMHERGFSFYLNKQAAYSGKISFCSFEYGESPLGPIVVEVETEDPQRAVLWLAPRTVQGTPVEEVKKPPDP
ncbi:MAG: hypothetical protein DRK00_00355 [Thermoprotei archaeon]|nr:MAG: hypothetical protein DRK00_00355 [Thermoprotei archaeon]